MQTPKAGEKIRITAVKSFVSTGISVGQILTVGEDPRQPLSQYDGYHWIEAADSGAKGWVKWEVVEVFTAQDVAAMKDALAIDRANSLVGGVLSYAHRTRVLCRDQEIKLASLNQRLTVAEREVQRLCTPAGSAYTYRNGAPHSDATVKRIPTTTQRDELHARASRQRREIRRLNQSQRVMKLESQALKRTNEDLIEKLISQNKMIRMLESK